MNTPASETIWLPRLDVLPSSLNPREHFDPEKINELIASFRERGFSPELSRLMVRVHPGDPGKYEIICGERRWRAANALELELLPAVIVEKSDCEVLELQLVENLQREDFTPLEEAKGFFAMLAFKDEKGEPVYSRETLSEKIGRTAKYVGDRLAVIGLLGTSAGSALEQNLINLSHARLLAKVPPGELRDSITERVLNPSDGLAPLPVRALEQIIRLECVRELRGCKFDPADAELVPLAVDPGSGDRVHGGACGDCPFNTKNSDVERDARSALCMNPNCYRLKEVAAYNRWAASVSDEKKGRVALDAEEAANIFGDSGKRLKFDSGYAELDDAPPEYELKKGVKDPAPWKKLIRGRGVPVVLVRDSSGQVHEIVERKLALAAARENEKDKPAPSRIFKPEGKEPSETPEQEEARQQQVNLARAREKRIFAAQMDALLAGAKRPKVPDGFWILAISALVGGLDFHGQTYDIADRRGLKFQDPSEALMKYAQKLPIPDQVALAVELLMAFYPQEDGPSALEKWAKAFGVDAKKVRKNIEEQIANEEKAAAAEAAISAALLPEKVRHDADKFEWNGSGICTNPDLIEILAFKLSKTSNLTAGVAVARAEKGWVVGAVTSGPKWGKHEPCRNTGTQYGNRWLAIKTGLLFIEQQLRANKAPEDALKRVAEFIAFVTKAGGGGSKKPKKS